LLLGDAPRPRHPDNQRRLQDIRRDSKACKNDFPVVGRAMMDIHLKQNYCAWLPIYRLVNSSPELHLPRAAAEANARKEDVSKVIFYRVLTEGEGLQSRCAVS
jgi:hypothetical protein